MGVARGMSGPVASGSEVTVRSFLLTPAELLTAARLQGCSLPEGVLRLVDGVDALLDAEELEPTIARLHGRGLAVTSPDGGVELEESLGIAIDCMSHAALSAVVLTSTDAARVALLLGAGSWLTAITRESDGIGVRVLRHHLFVATVAMLTGLHNAVGTVTEGSPTVVAELEPSDLDLERGTVPVEFEQELEEHVLGLPNSRCVALSTRQADGTVHREEVTWIVDERNGVFEIQARDGALQVATSAPNLLAARLVGALRA